MEDAPPKQRKEGQNVDKVRMDLVDAEALFVEAQVMSFGARKYSERSWERVIRRGESWRYIAAALRHLNALQRGEWNDPETGLPHAAHLACNAHFLTWAQLNGFFGETLEPAPESEIFLGLLYDKPLYVKGSVTGEWLKVFREKMGQLPTSGMATVEQAREILDRLKNDPIEEEGIRHGGDAEAKPKRTTSLASRPCETCGGKGHEPLNILKLCPDCLGSGREPA